ncbi:MAG: alpha/beta fold hydrolase [Myxococcota bacterium]|nr:alpha/beta fold hydrolase [Myxococcota bacterium]
MLLPLLATTALAASDVTLTTEDGTAVHARVDAVRGAEKGIVLVHMAGRSAGDWSHLSDKLARAGHSVIAPDLRGHGQNRSAEDDSELEDEQYAKMIQEVQASVKHLRESGVTQVSCAGASIGANLCLRAAAIDPGIVNLVLLSPGLNYKGVKTVDAIQAYGDRPVLLVASEDDNFAFRSASVLETKASGQRKFAILQDAGHGTKMLNRDPGLEGLVTSWLLGTYELSAGQPVAPRPQTAGPVAEDVKTTGEKLQSHQ